MTTAPPITAPLAEGSICPNCGYDLRGLTSENCPECGENLDAVYRQEPLIPWEHRKELGTLRAYYATMKNAFWRPDHFSRSVATPICPQAAESYRRITAGLASLTLGGLALWFYLGTSASMEPINHSAIGWAMGMSWLTLTLLVYWLPGLFSHAFRTATQNPIQRDRSISLSYYLWGWPLLFLLAIPAWLISIAVVIHIDGVRILTGALGVILFVGTLFGSLIVFERSLRRLLHHSALLSLGKLLLFSFLGGMQLIVFVMISASLFYFAVIFASLR